MSEISKKVAEMLLSTESIQVYKETPFVFVSGRISPVISFINVDFPAPLAPTSATTSPAAPARSMP